MANSNPIQLQGTVPLPPRLSLQGSLAVNWKQWKQIWDSFEIVSQLKKQAKEYRVATFITCVGTEALDIFNGLPFETEEDKTDMG